MEFFWCRNSDGTILRAAAGENRKSASPEKEDRYYTTRGSAEDTGKVTGDVNIGEEKAFVWPKLYITLSSKEKEEDFLAMKGCKLPQRPKKRAKIIQRTLLVSSHFKMESFVLWEKWEISEFFCDFLFVLDLHFHSNFSSLSLVNLVWFVCGGWLQLVSPGAWLTDMCQERYEVREKKSNKKVLCGWCEVYYLFCNLI